MTHRWKRRDVLRLAVIGGAGAALIGCGGGEPEGPVCTDTHTLSSADADFRRGQGYVDRSTRPGRNCDGCNFYTAGAPAACGTCTLIRGPISPLGYCNLWVQRA